MTRPRINRLNLLVLAFAALAAVASAHGQLRVATWNITNYRSGRTADIQTVVYGVFEGRSFAPDIILAQEIMDTTAMINFRAALNSAPGSPGDWDGRYVTGPSGGEGNALFFRTSKVVYKTYTIASQGGSDPRPPRHCVRFKVQPVGYTSDNAALFCYHSHMKSGSTSSDQARRLVEAQDIRDNAEALVAILPQAHFLLGADLNMQTWTEAAYQELVGSQPNNSGRFFDPIKSPGTWRDNYNLRFTHTQDPILENGGMDDRYDQILVSASLIDGDGFDYIGDPNRPYSTTTWNDPYHSYRSWGNDGTSFNQGLTVAGNTMVGPAIAQALINCATTAGGHLPVFFDLRVPPVAASDTTIDFGQIQQGGVAEQNLAVWNNGDVILWTAAGIANLRYTLSPSAGFAAPGGTFVDAAGGGANTHVITMDTSTLGSKSGLLTIASNAPDEPSRVVTLIGEVVAPTICRGDCNCDGLVTWRDIDFFVAAMNDNKSAWRARFLPGTPVCSFFNCDANADGVVTWRDIDTFVSRMNTTCPP